MYKVSGSFLFKHENYKKIVANNLLLTLLYTVSIGFVHPISLLLTVLLLAFHIAVLLIRIIAYYVDYTVNRVGKRESLVLAIVYLVTVPIMATVWLLVSGIILLIQIHVFGFYSDP